MTTASDSEARSCRVLGSFACGAMHKRRETPGAALRMNGRERRRRDSADIDGDQRAIPVGLGVCVRSENGSECVNL